jgi:antitoxin VapB
MPRTAKLFMNGRSQAVRLPSEFRFDADEVSIRKDPQTGDVILSRKSDNWDAFFKLRDALTSEEREAFEIPRDRTPLKARKLFE